MFCCIAYECLLAYRHNSYDCHNHKRVHKQKERKRIDAQHLTIMFYSKTIFIRLRAPACISSGFNIKPFLYEYKHPLPLPLYSHQFFAESNRYSFDNCVSQYLHLSSAIVITTSNNIHHTTNSIRTINR